MELHGYWTEQMPIEMWQGFMINLESLNYCRYILCQPDYKVTQKIGLIIFYRF